MKKILIAMLLVVGCLGLASCNDDNDELTDSFLTYYPAIKLVGDDMVLVPIGTEYTEEGCTATLRGEDCTDKINISGEVDTNTPGLYYITYSYTNVDGYYTSIQRTVAVCDPSITTDLSGSYLVAEGTNRATINVETGEVTAKVAFSGYGITITKLAPGLFSVSDFMGGYYAQRAGYGSSYAMQANIQLLADNSIGLLTSYVPGWGDSATGFSGGSYDPATGQISYTVNYASQLDFNIILTK